LQRVSKVTQEKLGIERGEEMHKTNIYIPLFLTAVAIGINTLWPNSFTQALLVGIAAITVILIVKDLLHK